MRNLYQFTKLYSGDEPELVDGDIFKTIVPLNLSTNKGNDNQNLNDNKERDCILAYIVQNGAISTSQAAQSIGRSHSTARRLLLQLVGENILVASGANRNKSYHLKDISAKLSR